MGRYTLHAGLGYTSNIVAEHMRRDKGNRKGKEKTREVIDLDEYY